MPEAVATCQDGARAGPSPHRARAHRPLVATRASAAGAKHQKQEPATLTGDGPSW